MQRAIALIQCPDQTGLIARITALVAHLGGNIIAADQHTTAAEGGLFFMRLEFTFDPSRSPRQELESSFSRLAHEIRAQWQLHLAGVPGKAGILVSRQTHCLADVLHRVREGLLCMDIAWVASNHEQARSLAGHYGAPFHLLPAEGKALQEAAILELAKGTDFLVLARYMQVLSAPFLKAYGRDIINIHHSFLPGFKGASPYQQAWDRGVKVIGATAHFVTEDLDEGPIIEQRVQRVSHRDSPEDLKRKGRDLEQQALAEALLAYTEHRVFRHGVRTVVFD
jgi:formyltetrahydrofolate deformylase